MTIKFTNNATTSLASSINSSVTELTVGTGQGALFPTLSGADVFYATISNTAGSVEIVKVTARSSDTFTIVRGQDNTSAASWSTGDKVELRATAAGFAAMAQTANNLSDLASAPTARTNLGLAAIAASGSASDLSTGTVATARLGTGTGSSSNYLRGDGAWTTVSRSGVATDVLGVPQTAQSSNYTLALTDIGQHIYSTNSGAQTLTIPTNASVAFPIGAAISLVNNGTTGITISTTSITLYQAGTSNTGNRTLAAKGLATLLKVGTDTWFISGAGLS